MKWPIGLYKISGQSMEPALKPGELYLGWRWFKPKAGQVVVVGGGRPLIKRIKRIDRQNIWLEGDNKLASTDSRSFGSVTRDQLEAVILKRVYNKT